MKETPCPGCDAMFGSDPGDTEALWAHVVDAHPQVADRLRQAVTRARERGRQTDWAKRHYDGIEGARPTAVAEVRVA